LILMAPPSSSRRKVSQKRGCCGTEDGVQNREATSPGSQPLSCSWLSTMTQTTGTERFWSPPSSAGSPKLWRRARHATGPAGTGQSPECKLMRTSTHHHGAPISAHTKPFSLFSSIPRETHGRAGTGKGGSGTQGSDFGALTMAIGRLSYISCFRERVEARLRCIPVP